MKSMTEMAAAVFVDLRFSSLCGTVRRSCWAVISALMRV